MLVIPFVNLGNTKAQPEVGLRDKINSVALKKNLSIQAALGESDKNLSMRKAPVLAKDCNADIIVWGTYEKSDSLDLIVNYFFTNQPQFNKTAELATLENVSALHKGTISKNLVEDVFLSLCSIIVMRDGNNALAKIWLDKIQTKDEIDEQILHALN